MLHKVHLCGGGAIGVGWCHFRMSLISVWDKEIENGPKLFSPRTRVDIADLHLQSSTIEQRNGKKYKFINMHYRRFRKDKGKVVTGYTALSCVEIFGQLCRFSLISERPKVDELRCFCILTLKCLACSWFVGHGTEQLLQPMTPLCSVSVFSTEAINPWIGQSTSIRSKPHF